MGVMIPKIEKRRAGRPKKNGAKTIMFGVRLNESERDKLVRFMEEYDMTASEVLRFLLNESYLVHFND